MCECYLCRRCVDSDGFPQQSRWNAKTSLFQKHQSSRNVCTGQVGIWVVRHRSAVEIPAGHLLTDAVQQRRSTQWQLTHLYRRRRRRREVDGRSFVLKPLRSYRVCLQGLPGISCKAAQQKSVGVCSGVADVTTCSAVTCSAPGGSQHRSMGQR